MANLFAKELGIPLPKCCSLGSCCKGASPSKPYHQLLKRAAGGDEFAQGFFSIMAPYASHAEAEKIVPGIVERTLKAAKKLEDFKTEEDIVFYQCRYQTPDNKCGVWEDRPQFCRDYPDTPFVVMAPGCAFEPWAAACKDKYTAMKDEVDKLKAMKAELAELYTLQNEAQPSVNTDPNFQTPDERAIPAGLPPYSHPDTKIDDPIFRANNTDNLSLVLSLTRLYVASPLQSMYRIAPGA